MKSTTTPVLFLCIFISLATGVSSQEPPKSSTPREAGRCYTSLDAPTDPESALPPGMLKFNEADLGQVLEIYQELSNRTIIRAGNLPNVKITLTSQTRLTRREALQTLDTVLAANSIVMIPLGTQHMKAVLPAQAPTEGAPLVELPSDQLPESATYITYIIQLKTFDPQEVIPMVQPFSKLPNSILIVPDTGVLVVRDYSVNVRRIIQILHKLEAARENPKGGKL